MVKALGHSVTEPKGSLVPLVSSDDCAKMQGLSLRNTELKLLNQKGKTVYKDFGELLFTHFGISGPMALSASAHLKEKESYTVVLDLKPALDEQKLDARFLRDFEKYANRSMENALADLFPHSMIPVILERAAIPLELKAHSLTKEQRRALLHETKAFRLPVLGTRPVEEAIITRGGISVKEIDPGTMESKRIKGLFFAGEIIDCDAYTGGFNLQIAWSTAYAAANACAQELKEFT
jgi:predicted Rossmann fold flavoprotein